MEKCLSSIIEGLRNIQRENYKREEKENKACPKCNGTFWVQGENKGYSRCSCFKEERNKRLWQKFGVNLEDIKTLDEYKVINKTTSVIKSGAVYYTSSHKKIKGTRENSFAVLGQSGSGKSHITIAIGERLIREGIEVVYMPYIEGMRLLKSLAQDYEAYTNELNRFIKAEVLIIDDLFKDKVRNGKIIGTLTEVDMKHIYPILNYRYVNKLSTIYSSELCISEIEELDEAIGRRIREACGRYMFNIIGREKRYLS